MSNSKNKRKRRKQLTARKTVKRFRGVKKKNSAAVPASKVVHLSRDEELAQKLVTNPDQAIKEMTAEYLIKNRERIMRNIEDYLVDLFG